MDLRVLIVDDDAATQRAMSRISEKVGYHAETAGSVEEALDKLGPFQRLLVDLNLPDGLGTTVLEHAKSVHPYAKVAVISATCDVELLDAVRLLAPDAIFLKPISASDLSAWLQTP
jgi:CheY-like chemotaxis protein